MSEEKKCCKTVYPKERWGSFHGHPCGKPAPLEHDGKPYCKLHHPPSRVARNQTKPKCAIAGCDTTVNSTKYCRFHAEDIIGHDLHVALLADKARLDWFDSLSCAVTITRDQPKADSKPTLRQWIDEQMKTKETPDA